MRTLLVWLIVVLVLSGCRAPATTPTVEEGISSAQEPVASLTPTITPPAVLNEEVVEDYFRLVSPAFGDGETIPPRYTCNGEDSSPPLSWGMPPEGTESFVLLMEDPDAQQVVGYTWVHWLVYDLPADLRGLEEGITSEAEVAGGRQGKNSWDRLGYGGPCPPSGQTHRYIFALYALDTRLDLPPGGDAETVKGAMEGHIIATTQLTGLYTSP